MLQKYFFDIIHETHLMKAYHHPNILPLYCSFVHGEDLWMVMPFIAGGSVLHIMKYAHPQVCTAPVHVARTCSTILHTPHL
jgi:serine/threonine-protein kinase OSR1/STK39